MIPRKNTALLIEECKRRNIPYTLHTTSVLEVHLGEGFFCADSRTPLQNSAVSHICKLKPLTKQLLDLHQVPTAAWKVVWKDQIIFPNHLQQPLICKPVDKKEGQGFERNINSQHALEEYFKKYPSEDKVLMEETLIGKEYRVLLIGRKVFSTLERNWDTGQKILIEVTSQMTPEVVTFFEHIAELFKADILAIDVIMEDISKIPEIKNYHGILELNSAPSLYRHASPDRGVGRNPAERIFDLLIERYL